MYSSNGVERGNYFGVESIKIIEVKVNVGNF